jgi:hypothetical protein
VRSIWMLFSSFFGTTEKLETLSSLRSNSSRLHRSAPSSACWYDVLGLKVQEKELAMDCMTWLPCNLCNLSLHTYAHHLYWAILIRQYSRWGNSLDIVRKNIRLVRGGSTWELGGS